MSQGVVDFLEMVQVDEQDRHLLAFAIDFLEFELQPVAQHAPVRQAGQHVEVGLVPDQRLGILARGDVGMGADHAQRMALRITTDHHAARQDPFPAAVAAEDAVLVVIGFRAPFEVVAAILEHRRLVLCVASRKSSTRP